LAHVSARSDSTLANRTLDEALIEARETYATRRPRSRATFDAAVEVMPGGNTRTILFHGPFPFRVARGEGAWLWDVDGHRYLNLLGEYTAGIFGHSHPLIREAIEAALNHGMNLGAHNMFELELARLVTARFPSIDKVRFTNSGTEGNLMAIATARAFTRRNRILVFKGGYHGGVFYFAGAGTPVNAPYEWVLARYNDIDATRHLIREHTAQLAAVLVEPMQGSGGCITADAAFLTMLRQETSNSGILLIFDEVMTSRVAPGGAQEHFAIRPDMTTLGKYIGGGASFGAFGGRADIMDLYDPRRADALPHAGTFNNNVFSMAAGIAGLSKIYTPDAARALSARGDKLRNRLNQCFRDNGVAFQATGLASLLNVHPVAHTIRSSEDLADADDRLRELFFLDMLEHGFYLARRGMIALSLAVTDADIDNFVTTVGDWIGERRSQLPVRKPLQ
jgi:glutamate-1-semialdehyde 2,1-aminomutase